MEILRHTRISRTRRYVKDRPRLSKGAMRRMGDAIMLRPETSAEIRTETRDSCAARARRRHRIL